MIIKRVIVYIGFSLLVTACYQFKKPEKPKGLISKETMVNILIDVKLLAVANTEAKKKMKDSGIVREKYIYAKYNIDSAQFALSNNYYAYHVKDYEDIYLKVKDSLEQLVGIYKALEEKEEKEEKRKKDSINVAIKAKDSINIIKRQDSLKGIKKRDSLIEIKLQEKFEDEGELISPVSDTDSQP